MRTTTLARLFDHLTDGDTEREVVQPTGLEVFAWDPETCDPGFFPVAAITRRWFEGDLLGVKHGLYRGVRATPDHPFVVAAEAGGPTTVKLGGGAHDRRLAPVRPDVAEQARAVPERRRAPALGLDGRGRASRSRRRT